MQAVSALKPFQKFFQASTRSISTSHKLLFRSDLSTLFAKAAKPLNDKPLEFLSSKAKTWNAYDTFIDQKIRDTPDSQPFVIIVSLTAFILYFGYLREENDFDEFIYKPLEETIKSSDSAMVKGRIQEYENYGLDTSKIKSAVSSTPPPLPVKK